MAGLIVEAVLGWTRQLGSAVVDNPVPKTLPAELFADICPLPLEPRMMRRGARKLIGRAIMTAGGHRWQTTPHTS